MKLTGRIQEDLKSFAQRPRSTRPHKIPRTWIMVVDQHIARVFEKGGKGLESIGEAFPDFDGEIEMSNQSIGRNASSSGPAVHHKYEPSMNASRQAPLSFIHQISDWLDKAVWEDAFDRIILVAPPFTLGELRKIMKRSVHARVIAEINKDLTKINEKDLHNELTKIVWF